jgi:hypothetical protein
VLGSRSREGLSATVGVTRVQISASMHPCPSACDASEVAFATAGRDVSAELALAPAWSAIEHPTSMRSSFAAPSPKHSTRPQRGLAWIRSSTTAEMARIATS